MPNVITPGVLIALFCCVTVVYLARLLRSVFLSHTEDAVEQLIEDNGVVMAALENHTRKFEAIEKKLEEQGHKVTNLALTKIR